MGYTFARASAAVQMKVEDCYIQTWHGWVRFREKGGKVNNPLSSQPGRVFGCMDYRVRPGAESTVPSSRHSSAASSWATRPCSAEYLRDGPAPRGRPGIATKISSHSFLANGITSICRIAGSLKLPNK
jgi:hypothetical protein